MRKKSFVIAGTLVGFSGSFLPWGDPDGVHGRGVPVAQAISTFRNGEEFSETFYWALVINTVTGVICGGLLIFAANAFSSFRRRRRSAESG